jgi:hypothetical protein
MESDEIGPTKSTRFGRLGWVGMLATALLVSAVRPGTCIAATTRVVVDAEHTLGSTRGALLGVGWNTGDLEQIAPLRPPFVRIDSRLESSVPAPGVYELDTVLDKVARVRRVGGEPLVILFATPAWLGEPRAAGCAPDPIFFPDGCNPTLVAPSDLGAWEELIAEVVRRLATAPEPAHRFEVWNEPDIGVFWHDTQEAFLETAAATHRAIRAVAEETGLPLEVGGPASFSPGGVARYVAAIVDAGLPLHFVSWHWYANSPFLGPDGAEGNIDPVLYEALRGVNPDMTPSIYGAHAREVRSQIEPLLTAADLDPVLLIDEWNISAGGLDLRHDSNEGAAFAAASLIEMERAGLDGAALYRSNSDRDLPGDWGMIGKEGEKKPVWWVFDAFQRTSGRLVAVSGDDPAGGFWARASRRGRRLDVFLATFRALGGSSRSVDLVPIRGCAAESARVATIDAGTRDFRSRRTVLASAGSYALDLPDQSVTWVEMVCDADGEQAQPRCLPRRGAIADPARGPEILAISPAEDCPKLGTREQGEGATGPRSKP